MKFEIENRRIICFESGSDFYEIEKSGEKSNTVRERTAQEILNGHISLSKGVLFCFHYKITHIRISEVGSDNFFTKELTNVCVYKNSLIFSWSH